MHGYLESPESDSVRLIVNAYYTRNEHNLIVLDWSDAASGDYFINAVPNAITVITMIISIRRKKNKQIIRFNYELLFQLGNILASVVLRSFKRGLDSEKFHVVSHSLGAQIAGVMGRKIISKSNQSQKLKRFEGFNYK